ncbi:hypothetical protein [Bradyrhizobium niftali]|uniref:hypothetical protein n=1 Tax=Bradyrhizobium niftali TaxID=2560055 RepID=UPI00384F5862
MPPLAPASVVTVRGLVLVLVQVPAELQVWASEWGSAAAQLEPGPAPALPESAEASALAEVAVSAIAALAALLPRALATALLAVQITATAWLA